MRFNLCQAELTIKAADIDLVAFDVDGVLTDGHIHYSNDGELFKAFNSLDGYGIKQLIEKKIIVVLITARKSNIVQNRFTELGVTHIYQGIKNKSAQLEILLNEFKINRDNALYMGDDIPDLLAMKHVGFAVAPANAHPDILHYAHCTTHARGGEGAVRELCDFILYSKKLYLKLIELTENKNK